MNLAECETLFDEIRHTFDQKLLISLFSRLLNAYEILNCTLGPGSIFWRGRRSEANGFKTISELSYPPADLCMTGRLNDKFDPTFYAATRETTVLSELNTPADGHVHLIGYRISAGNVLHLASFGEYYSIHKTGLSHLMRSDPCLGITRLLNSYSNEKAEILIFIDAFLAEILSDASASKYDYVHTRALKVAALKAMPHLDGLFYPSVKDKPGMNLTLWREAFDRTMQPVCSQVIQVKRVYDYGTYEYERYMHAIGIEENGEFIMQSPDSDASHIFFSPSLDELNRIEQGLRKYGHKSRGLVRYHKLLSSA